MAHTPELLLLDEPMAGLDATTQHQLLDLLAQLRSNGAPVVLSTHDLSCVSSRCDKACCLNRKQIAFGKPSDVLNEQVLGDTFGTHLLMVHSGWPGLRIPAPFPILTSTLNPNDYQAMVFQ
ncbi:MAG: hypothetical protein Ct9H300mP11_32210 [Chloroflexota bacterium]|nr:MAG: hypothetical protein Ct9H300mP11_32210 [Chloroflexota bacterium]